MPDCPVCAFDNPASAAACANCGADLRAVAPVTAPFGSGHEGAAGFPDAGDGDVSAGTAGTEQEQPRVRAQRPAVPAPREPARGSAEGGRKGAALALEPTELEVDPGSSVVTTVTAHNLGTEVERFTLEVNGPGGAFASAEPPDLRMLPDKKQSAQIRFSPAHEARQRAGPHPFQVVARSTVNPDVVQRVSGVVTVGAFARLGAELTPEVTRGRRPGSHRLALVNEGNQPAAVQIELHDETGELVFDPPRFDEVLDPGGRAEPALLVGGPVPWFGRTKSFPFTAEVTSTGVPQPVHLQGVRRQVPRFPWWIPTVALALVGVAIALVALLVRDPQVPSVARDAQSEAMQTLKDAGFSKVVPIQQVSKTVDAGRAIGTEPQAGGRYPKGKPVSLFISRGPCEGPCLPIVPNVVTLTVDEARTQLARAGLKAQQLPVADEAPADTVVATEPTANSPAGADKTVTLKVSTGPAAATAAATSTSASASSGSAAGSSTTAAQSTPPAGGGGGPVVVPPPPGTQVTMPDVVGRSEAEARAAVEKVGLQVTTATTWTNGAPRGQVVDTTPKANTNAKAGDTVTLTLADPTAVSMQDPARPAQWSAGGVTIQVASADGGSPPLVFTGNEVPGDQSSPPLLVTEPAPGGSVTGRFDLSQKVIPGDHLRAQVRFAAGAVTFAVRAGGRDLPVPDLGPVKDGVQPLDVDLSSVAGARDLEITVLSASAGGSARVVWKDLRVEGQTE